MSFLSLVRDQEVDGSNPFAPTISPRPISSYRWVNVRFSALFQFAHHSS
jgi:hypothetical protein